MKSHATPKLDAVVTEIADDMRARADRGEVAHYIPELARVEETAVAAGTRLIPDMRLLAIDHTHHPDAAARAVDPALTVVLRSDLGITRIEDLRALPLAEIAVLEGIEPQSLASSTAIHLDAVEPDRLQAALALGAVHPDSEW